MHSELTSRHSRVLGIILGQSNEVRHRDLLLPPEWIEGNEDPAGSSLMTASFNHCTSLAAREL